MLSQIMTKISGGVTFLGGVLIVFGLVNLGMTRRGFSSSSCSRERVPLSDSWPLDLSESVSPSSDP